MDFKINVQGTPNPNAIKFVLNVPVRTNGNVTYKNADECESNPLARQLFTNSHVVEVYFYDNYITITQDGNGDWDVMGEEIQKIILDNIETHDPNFKIKTEPAPVQAGSNTPEIAAINGILDQTVRPALQMDGGDLQIIGLEGNVLTISYQGACGSCPSATLGTLKAVENLLRDQYNPEMVVQSA